MKINVIESDDYSYSFSRYEQAPADVQEKQIKERASKVDNIEE